MPPEPVSAKAPALRDLFDQVVELPPAERPAFLDRVCADRADLRRAVERLLSADARLGDLFASASFDSSSDGAEGPASPGLERGTRLGPYEVLASLGAGGMGEVYTAKDLRLARTVAIKVISPRLVGSARAREHFMREAHAVAALSHPHICQLFDVGHHEGLDYLVMEFLAGETLAARLRRGALPRAEALTCAAQIAQALSAAHAAGIVHRDLKPANIMLTPTGARLLDFGLARAGSPAADDAGATAPPPVPEPGVILGTLPYVSPELLEGRPTDARADVFSFGAVLFEMLTGRRAFDGTTGAAVVAQILSGEPPALVDIDPTSPPWLQRFVARCLAGSREARFQSMAEVTSALVAGQRPRRRPVLIAAGLVGLVSGAAALSLMSPAAPLIPTVQSVRRITYDGVMKDVPYTDGRFVYYTAWGPGFATTSVWRVPVTGGRSIPLPMPAAMPYLVDVSTAGTMLLIERAGRAVPAPQLMAMSVRGGAATPVGSARAWWADLSFDERRLVFARGTELFVAAADGSAVRKLLTAPGTVGLPRWAPDGHRVRYTVSVAKTRETWEADDTGNARPVLPGWFAGVGTWTPDGRHYVFEAERDGDYGLWAVPASPRGAAGSMTPTKLTTGPLRFENPTVSPDGSTIFALGSPPPTGELVRFDLRTRQYSTPLGSVPATDVTYSPDGRDVAYVRYDDGTLWRSKADGTDARQLTFGPGWVLLPTWSPDARNIAYAARLSGGAWQTFVIDAGGGVPRLFSAGNGDQLDPTWSPDGARLALSDQGGTNRETRIYIVDVASGRSEPLPGSDGLFAPRWSPDGRFISATERPNGRLMLLDLSTRQWRVLLPAPAGWPYWTRRPGYMQAHHGSQVVRVRVADGRIEPIFDLNGIALTLSPQISAPWIGIDATDAPLFLRQVGSMSEIYAIAVDWH